MPNNNTNNTGNTMRSYISSIPEFKPSAGMIGLPGGGRTVNSAAPPMNYGYNVAAPAGIRVGSSTYEVQASRTPLPPAVIAPTSFGTSQQGVHVRV